MSYFQLLTVGHDAKTVKGEKYGFLTGILYLLPALSAGLGKNLCPWASEGCKAVCLNTAGRGAMSNVQKGRLRKTKLLFENPKLFETQLFQDISRLERRAKRLGLIPCVRLDGTSDLGTAIRFARWFPDVQFYDYTKSQERYNRWLNSPAKGNYHLTFSYSENVREETFVDFLSRGGTVAVAFHVKKKAELPDLFLGFPVIDGDLSDVRFKDESGVIVGLRAKGKARKDTSGFVVQP